MSPVEQDVTAPRAIGYCAWIVAALNLVVSGAVGELFLLGTSRGGAGREARVRQLDGTRPAFHSLPCLDWLEQGLEVRVSAAVHDSGNRGPVQLGLLFASWAFTPEFGRRSEEDVMGAYYIGDADTARVAEPLARFPLPPSLVVDAGGEVWAGWALTEPLADFVDARRLQRALAIALGADTGEHAQPHGRPARPADDPGVFLPIGGVVRNMGASPPPRIALPLVEPSRIYPLTDLERAIAGEPAAAPRKKGTRP